ncbi:MAG: S4 domain-containing protein YaaA [Candidatus Paralactobacillus gallistercoris]|uniref:S4 domain-containing protein YaaA n=1 Tax=Candidatus Paralactobacillus gallistercoris TaxID=2838724 RepID=A0A948TIA1_9LACO|nr:S4 domain-containing protein YaaA [Candidatus Paralactobacillus gallistercoris]
MSLTTIQISSDYITLGQFLKEIGVIATGGQAKWFLADYDVIVNNTIEKRRGRKLSHGDCIQIPDVGAYQIA